MPEPVIYRIYGVKVDPATQASIPLDLNDKEFMRKFQAALSDLKVVTGHGEARPLGPRYLLTVEGSEGTISVEVQHDRVVAAGHPFLSPDTKPWTILEEHLRSAAPELTDAEKERNAHVFLSAWKIWLEMRRRKGERPQG